MAKKVNSIYCVLSFSDRIDRPDKSANSPPFICHVFRKAEGISKRYL